jgi:hypothetical protein
MSGREVRPQFKGGTMRKVSLILVAVAILALASFAIFAGAGDTPAKAPCAQKAGDAKAGCAHGADAKACCAHQKDMTAAFDALQKDLTTMEKGIPAADQAAFMKSHEANLKKFVDAHSACQKECQMKKDAPKAETKEAPKAAEPATKN